MHKPLLNLPRFDRFITRFWLPTGLLVLLTGLFWATDGSAYMRLYYGLMAIPAGLALLLAPRRIVALLREPAFIVVLLFCGWLILSLLWSGTGHDKLNLAKRPLYIVLLFAACALMAWESQERLFKTLRIGCLLAIAATFIGLIISFNDILAGERLIGTGALRNALLTSYVLGFFCVYWITNWLFGFEKNHWVPALATLVLLAALLSTGSRTPFMALFFTGLWLTLISRRQGLHLVALLLAVFATIFFLTPDVFLQRKLSFRPEIWSQAIDKASQHPWLGYGYDNGFTFTILDGQQPIYDAHNLELSTLLELGSIGLALWLVLYALLLRHCWMNRQDPRFRQLSALVVYGFFAGLTVGSTPLSRPHESWFLTWIPFALTLGLYISKRLQPGAPKRLDEKAFATLLEGSQHIETDAHGLKVARLADGRFLKLFRRRRSLSTALWSPPSWRFVKNAQHLHRRNIAAPTVLEVIEVPALRVRGILYQPLPGETLRGRWRRLSHDEREQEVWKFGAFLGSLHEKGVYFRSLHLANVLYLPDDRFGLIDLSDMRVWKRPLPDWLRQRNLQHILRYPEDAHWLQHEHREAWLAGYGSVTGQVATAHLTKALDDLKHDA